MMTNGLVKYSHFMIYDLSLGLVGRESRDVFGLFVSPRDMYTDDSPGGAP